MRRIDDASPVKKPARRKFLALAGTAALTATAAGLLVAGPAAAAETKAKPKAAGAQGAAPFNNVLGLEWELVAAYRLFTATKLLSKTAFSTAQVFLAHHKAHTDTLSGLIKSMGATPVAAKPDASYAKALNVAALKTAPEVMRVAIRLEKGAADAYFGMIAGVSDPVLAQVIGRLGADGAMHWGVIADALGAALPQNAMSFGA